MGHVESFCNKKTSFCVHARPFALQLKNKGEKLCVGMAIWMKGHKELSKEANVLQQKDAETVVKEFFECIASAELFSEVGNHTLHTLKQQQITTAHHSCSSVVARQVLVVFDGQGPRNPCHKRGHTHEEGRFAHCGHCDKKWTSL